MASAEEKQKKKEEAEAARDLRNAGNVPRWQNFHLDAGRRVRLAWAWIPRLRLMVLLSCAVSILATVAAVAAVYSRPSAMIFMVMPDGTIACAPVSAPDGRPVRRQAAQQALCDRLAPPVGLTLDTTPAGGK